MEVSGQLQEPTMKPIGENSHGTHWREDWVGLRANMDPVENGKLSVPAEKRITILCPFSL
jgi:hypothetical protein